MPALNNKIVLITGASSGIGREAALGFARQGAITVLAARSVDKLREIAGEIKQQTGQEAGVYALDVQDAAQVDAVVAEVMARYGRVDILVNNAGWGVFKETVDVTMQEVEEMMDVNYLGLVRMTKAVLPPMIQRGDGLIINIASIASFFAAAKHGAYAATKFAVQGFSEALRYELKGTGVTVSTINPGPVETAFWERADRTTVPSFTPFLNASQVVDAILKAAVQKKSRYLLPKIGSFGVKLKYLFPGLYEQVMTRSKK